MSETLQLFPQGTLVSNALWWIFFFYWHKKKKKGEPSLAIQDEIRSFGQIIENLEMSLSKQQEREIIWIFK